MSTRMHKAFSRELQNLDAAGLLRTEMAAVHNPGMQVQLGPTRNPTNFCGTDFLGWRNNEAVLEAARQACAQYGTGNTCSRGTIGTLEILQTLENKLAQFLSLEDCILFPSGYVAYLGLFEPLTNYKDKIFLDEMCNPGLIDGTRLSSSKVATYLHNDEETLEYHLKCSQNNRFRLIVTDGVFSADGQLAKLESIHALKTTYDAISLIDESLSLGVLGQNGRGSASHLQVTNQADMVCGSFAYALGNVGGGFVGGPTDLIKWLRHASRSYLLSEPLSPVCAATVLTVLDILESDPGVIQRLHEKSNRLKEKIRQQGWQLIENDHPLVSIKVGSTMNVQKMVEHLFEQDFIVSGLCYPNTPEGESLIRIVPTVNHSDEHIDRLVSAIEQSFASLN